MPTLVEELFGEGKKYKDLTTEQRRQYDRTRRQPAAAEEPAEEPAPSPPVEEDEDEIIVLQPNTINDAYIAYLLATEPSPPQAPSPPEELPLPSRLVACVGDGDSS